MLKEIIIAFQSFTLAHQFIKKNGMWKYIFISGLFYAASFAAALYFFWIYSNEGIEYLLQSSGIMGWLEKENNGWLHYIIIVAQMIIVASLLALFISWFKYVFLIIAAPMLAYLSEKTDSIISGKDFPFSIMQLLKDAGRGIRISIRNLLWQSVYLLAIFILSFIPVVGWIAPLIAILVECYYFGFSMLDYNNERRNIPVRPSIEFIGNHKGLAIGNGLCFYLLHLLPVIGWLLAPSYAVIAATLSIHESQSKNLIPEYTTL